MNTRQWRYFLSVAEIGNITRAAAQLHLTQPALSRHLKQLEEDLGARLLTRQGRGVRLTSAGLHFREVAKEIMRRLDDLHDEIQAHTDEPAGDLAVGLPLSWGGLVSPQLITRFVKQYPRVKLQIQEGTTIDLHHALKTRKLHMAVVTDLHVDNELHQRKLLTEDCVLIGSRDAELDSEDSLDPAAVAGHPFVLLPYSSGVRVWFESVLAESRVTVDTIVEVNSILLMELVARGLGLSIMPTSALEGLERRERFSFTRLRGFSITWTCATLKGRPKAAATVAFEACLRQCLEDLVAGGQWPSAQLPVDNSQKVAEKKKNAASPGMVILVDNPADR
jgi:LysR family nitrogen assimilation transcriptional regulator